MSAEQVKESKMNEKVVAEFQQLRNEQRNLVNNLNTLEMDLKEHKWVAFVHINITSIHIKSCTFFLTTEPW